MPRIDLTRISTVTDAEAARLASPAAFTQLAGQITATPFPSTVPEATQPDARRARPEPRATRRWSRRRALLTGLPIAAITAAAALVAGLLIPGDNGANSQAAIQAIRFVRENGHITVIIKNPYADSSWYNADFARHHLDIRLTLIPASPSFVGAIEYMSTDSNATSDEIKLITKQGSCGLDGTGCTIGFTIPADFHGQAAMGIGRPARPGEQYETTGSIFSPGEALAGLRSQVAGHDTVGEVWALLRAHHLTIEVCRDQNNSDTDPAKVPANWYVHDISPWAPNQVFVAVGPNPGFYAG